MASKTLATVPASTVRVWAAEQGLATGGARGLLPQATIEAFNEAHKPSGQVYRAGQHTEVREVKVTTKDSRNRNRSVVRKVSAEQARAAHLAAGGSVRGRLPMSAYLGAAEAMVKG